MATATTNIQDFARLYADLVEKAWNDPKFLAQLEENPIRSLEASGILTPPGATVNIVLRKLDRNAKLADQFNAGEYVFASWCVSTQSQRWGSRTHNC
jgi:hypothetical protein